MSVLFYGDRTAIIDQVPTVPKEDGEMLLTLPPVNVIDLVYPEATPVPNEPNV